MDPISLLVITAVLGIFVVFKGFILTMLGVFFGAILNARARRPRLGSPRPKRPLSQSVFEPRNRSLSERAGLGERGNG